MGLAERIMDFVSAPDEADIQDDYDLTADAYNSSIQPGVVLFKPTGFQQAREITDHLMPNHAIVINLEQVESEHLRRMVDFFAGIAYGIQGTFTRAAKRTYLIVPPDVDCIDERVSGWEQDDPMVL